MQLGAHRGNATMDDSLAELVGKYVITLEEALPAVSPSGAVEKNVWDTQQRTEYWLVQESIKSHTPVGNNDSYQELTHWQYRL